MNVCRFYAGSCERGETGTLVLSLEEMIKTGDLAVASHARRVGLALLQDWVFSNAKYPQDQLIRTIFDDDGTQFLISGEGRVAEELTLDAECGRDTLRDRVFEQLKTWPIDVRTSVLCQVLRANGGRDLGQEFCELLAGQTGEPRTNQLIRMFRAGASADLAPEQVWQLITEDDPERDQLLRRSSELLWAEPAVAEKVPQLVSEFTRGVLDGLVGGFGHHSSVLGVFADLLGNTPGSYIGLRLLGEHGFLAEETPGSAEAETAPVPVRSFVDAVGTISLDRTDDTFDQRRSPELWSSIAESAREHYGDTWATMSMAIRTAGIRTATELPDGSDRLFDSTAPVCARARAARLRRGGTSWWLEQLEDASSPLERTLWAGLVLMWSSAKNLYELSSQTNAIVDSLSDDEYDALRSTLASTASSREIRADRKKLSEVNLEPFSDRTALLVAVALKAEPSRLIYTTKQGRAEPLRSFLKSQRELQDLDVLPSWKDPDEALAWARRLNQLRRHRRGPTYRARKHLLDSRLRVESAEKVLKEPREYPPELVSRAVMEVQRRYRPRTLATASSEQDWVFD